MREYSNTISFTENERGVYSIDPILGCESDTKENSKGCYNDCYAARIARIYGYDFSKSVKRDFISKKHIHAIKKKINKSKLPFIRMGTMGDPSEDWEHTIKICRILQTDEQLPLFDVSYKEIVIITKHWFNMSDSQLNEISKYKICINTSISVMDDPKLLENSLLQYERLKPYCRSILRIVSADFNTDNGIGKLLYEKQNILFNRYKCLDTVFRVSKHNPLVKEGVINFEEAKFLGKKTHISKFNKRTYFGKCNKCSEMCGVKMQ